MHGCARKNRWCKCGAASVEAVVVLPVFVILFIGVSFVRDLTGAKADAEMEARRCAWEYSVNNCVKIPEGCSDILRQSPLGDIDSDVQGAWSKGIKSLEGGKFQSAILNALTETVLDALAKAFTQSFEANRAVERDRPALFGGGKSQVTGKYHLACNLESRDQDYIVNAVWDFLVP